jgi:hypothetical protein
MDLNRSFISYLATLVVLLLFISAKVKPLAQEKPEYMVLGNMALAGSPRLFVGMEP